MVQRFFMVSGRGEEYTAHENAALTYSCRAFRMNGDYPTVKLPSLNLTGGRDVTVISFLVIVPHIVLMLEVELINDEFMLRV